MSYLSFRSFQDIKNTCISLVKRSPTKVNVFSIISQEPPGSRLLNEIGVVTCGMEFGKVLDYS